MSKGLCRSDIIRILSKYNLVQREFTVDDLTQLMSNLRAGYYWVAIASRYNIIGSTPNIKSNNVEPMEDIEMSTLQLYGNLLKYDYAVDRIVA